MDAEDSPDAGRLPFKIGINNFATRSLKIALERRSEKEKNPPQKKVLTVSQLNIISH